MRLQHPIESHDRFVEVIQNFNFRWFLAEEYLGASGHWLYVGGVIRHPSDDLASEPILASDVWEWTDHALKRPLYC